MTKSFPILIVLVLVAGVFYSCEKERDPCLQPRTIVLRAGAYHPADTGRPIHDTALPDPVLIAITTYTTQNAVHQTTQRNKFTFQLSETADSCSWVVRPDSAVAIQDTLTFFYQRQLRFLSNACGYTYFFNLQQVRATRHALDSVLINNSSV